MSNREVVEEPNNNENGQETSEEDLEVPPGISFEVVVPPVSSEEEQAESPEGSAESEESEASESTTSKVSTRTMSSEITIGGIKVKIGTTPKQPQDIERPLYSKEKRSELSEDKRNDLFERATRKSITEFDLMSLSLDDEAKLDDTYNVGILVEKMRAHFVRYDMHDVFTVLTLEKDDKTIKSETNLFKNYAAVTEEQVAASNEWYATWPEADYFGQNLQLTYDFLQNNMTENLWEKCLETYQEYPMAQHGGPLLFVIMMKKLQSDTEAAVDYLKTRVKEMKITNFDGEDVTRAVSLIRGAYKRLKNVKTNAQVGNTSSQGQVPNEFSKWLIAIFQTTSVPQFNETFAHLQRDAEIAATTDTGTPKWPSVDRILSLAEKKYLEMASTGDWTGVTTKGNQTGFHSSSGSDAQKKDEVLCWNCNGKGHTLNECPKPKNTDLIAQRRQDFFMKRRKNKQTKRGTGKGKFAPPSAQEKRRRVIDGKPMYWLTSKKRWVDDKKPPVTNPPAGNVTQTDPATQTTGNPSSTMPSANAAEGTTPSNPDQRAAMREAALSNAQQQMQTAMRNFLTSFQE